MASSKMTKCKACGHDISAKGKVTCPSCGKIYKKPIYKRGWFIVLCVIVLIGAISGLGSDSTTKSTNNTDTVSEKKVEEVKEPIIVSVDELMDALDSNALKASKTYDGQYVKLTGKLSVIDSSGSYFSLTRSDEFAIIGVLCKIKDEHLDTVMEFVEDQDVTVYGTITDVGEVMGYTLKVESIE